MGPGTRHRGRRGRGPDLRRGRAVRTPPSDHASAATGDPAIARTVAYLNSAQNSDGGFGAGPHAQSSSLYTAWAVLGLAAAGRPVDNPSAGGHTAAQFEISSLARSPSAGDLERTMLALSAAGASVTHAAGRDLRAELERMTGSDGSFSHQVNLTAFAVFALRAAGVGTSRRGHPPRRRLDLAPGERRRGL